MFFFHHTGTKNKKTLNDNVKGLFNTVLNGFKA